MNHERAAIFEQEKQPCNHVHHETILRVTRLPHQSAPCNFEEKVNVTQQLVKTYLLQIL